MCRVRWGGSSGLGGTEERVCMEWLWMSLGVCVHFPRKHTPMFKAQHKDQCSRKIPSPLHSLHKSIRSSSTTAVPEDKFTIPRPQMGMVQRRISQALVLLNGRGTCDLGMSGRLMPWATTRNLSQSPGIISCWARLFQHFCVRVGEWKPIWIPNTVMTGWCQWSAHPGLVWAGTLYSGLQYDH